MWPEVPSEQFEWITVVVDRGEEAVVPPVRPAVVGTGSNNVTGDQATTEVSHRVVAVPLESIRVEDAPEEARAEVDAPSSRSPSPRPLELEGPVQHYQQAPAGGTQYTGDGTRQESAPVSTLNIRAGSRKSGLSGLAGLLGRDNNSAQEVHLPMSEELASILNRINQGLISSIIPRAVPRTNLIAVPKINFWDARYTGLSPSEMAFLIKQGVIIGLDSKNDIETMACAIEQAKEGHFIHGYILCEMFKHDGTMLPCSFPINQIRSKFCTLLMHIFSPKVRKKYPEVEQHYADLVVPMLRIMTELRVAEYVAVYGQLSREVVSTRPGRRSFWEHYREIQAFPAVEGMRSLQNAEDFMRSQPLLNYCRTIVALIKQIENNDVTQLTDASDLAAYRHLTPYMVLMKDVNSEFDRIIDYLSGYARYLQLDNLVRFSHEIKELLALLDVMVRKMQVNTAEVATQNAPGFLEKLFKI